MKKRIVAFLFLLGLVGGQTAVGMEKAKTLEPLITAAENGPLIIIFEFLPLKNLFLFRRTNKTINSTAEYYCTQFHRSERVFKLDGKLIENVFNLKCDAIAQKKLESEPKTDFDHMCKYLKKNKHSISLYLDKKYVYIKSDVPSPSGTNRFPYTRSEKPSDTNPVESTIWSIIDACRNELGELSLMQYCSPETTPRRCVLSAIPNLHTLTLKGYRIRMPILRAWEFHYDPISPRILNEISNLTNLKNLTLDGLGLSGDCDLKYLRPLKKLNSLHILSIGNYRQTPNLNLEVLKNLPCLKKVAFGKKRIFRYGRLLNRELRHLPHCIEVLKIYWPWITDDSVCKYIVSLPNIRILGLCGKEITDKSLEALQAMKKLEEVVLKYCHTTKSKRRELLKGSVKIIRSRTVKKAPSRYPVYL